MQRMQVAKRTLWFLKSPHHMLRDGGPQLRASPGSWGAMRRDKGWTGSCSWTESCASLVVPQCRNGSTSGRHCRRPDRIDFQSPSGVVSREHSLHLCAWLLRDMRAPNALANFQKSMCDRSRPSMRRIGASAIRNG